MIDFFLKTRQDMIDNLQVSLRAIRQLLNLSAQDLAELIGLTRQTINNLETGKSQMTPTQYISICAVIDNLTMEKPEMLPAIIAVLSASVSNTNKADVSNVHNASFLKKWFLSFPHDQENSSEFLAFTANNYDGLLKIIAQNYKIFCDWNSLMSAGAVDFFAILTPKLIDAKNHIIIPLRVVEYLQQLILSPNQDDSHKAQKALSLLGNLQKQGVIQIRGEKGDSNVYSTFVSVFARYKSSYRLFLITQDAMLGKDILDMNRKEGMSGFPISSGYLSDDGNIKLYEDFSCDVIIEKTKRVEDISDDVKVLIEEVPKGWDSIE